MPEDHPQKEYAPREEFTDINVNSAGQWFTGSKHIWNPKVLTYFRKNLQRDDKGLFIWNEFEPFKEKGYIKVNGPPVSVISMSEDQIFLNSGSFLSINDAELVQFQELPYLKVPSLGVWASFPGKMANDLAAGLEENDGKFYYRSIEMKTVQKMEWLLDSYFT